MTRRAWLSLIADMTAIVVFVALGRRTHDEDGLGGVLAVAAPFLIALLVGWVASRAWRRPMAVEIGIQLWLIVLVIGMVLRRFVFDRGTALPFVIVATLILGTLLVGWRVAVTHLRSRAAA